MRGGKRLGQVQPRPRAVCLERVARWDQDYGGEAPMSRDGNRHKAEVKIEAADKNLIDLKMGAMFVRQSRL